MVLRLNTDQSSQNGSLNDPLASLNRRENKINLAALVGVLVFSGVMITGLVLAQYPSTLPIGKITTFTGLGGAAASVGLSMLNEAYHSRLRKKMEKKLDKQQAHDISVEQKLNKQTTNPLYQQKDDSWSKTNPFYAGKED